MTRASAQLALVYSGGPSNSLASGSIGGAASGTTLRFIRSQSHSGSTIPGLTINHASRNPEGVGTLSYTAATTTVTWTNPLGVVTHTKLSSSGEYAVGTNTSGYLRLTVAYPSLGPDATQPVTIYNLRNTLFGKPDDAELPTGTTDYRALYLVNRSAATLENVLLTMTDAAPESVLSIGSSFAPRSVYTTDDASRKKLTLLNYFTGTGACSESFGSTIKREALEVFTPSGSPHTSYYVPEFSQNSDGVTEDIEILLADGKDSTGALAVVDWGTTVSWATIPAGRMVSFWVRRVLPPNPAMPTFEQAKFDVTFTQS